jgi:hypothetical protein
MKTRGTMQLNRRLAYSRLLLRTHPRRYVNLFRTIYKFRCRNLVEIGTWNGVHAEQMIQVAAIRAGMDQVRYSGFDLFEELTEQQLRDEFSKRPPSYEEVARRLQRTGAEITLHRGNTRATLPLAADELRRADLVFVDGGHSIETISADWASVQRGMGPRTTVLFDDYYPDRVPALEGLGCQSMVDSLDPLRYAVELLEPTDAFDQPWGTLRVKMARVRMRTS